MTFTNCAASRCLCLASSRDKERAASASRRDPVRLLLSRPYNSAASAALAALTFVPIAIDSLRVRFSRDPANLERDTLGSADVNFILGHWDSGLFK